MNHWRIDLAFRAVGVTIQVRYPTGVGGYTTVAIADGIYYDAQVLAAAVHAALQSVSASLSCTVASATFTIASSAAAYDIIWSNVTLRKHLGILGNLVNKTTWSGFSTRIFISSTALTSDALTWVRARKVDRRDHNRVSVVPVGSWREWTFDLLVKSTELTTLRGVLAYALRGHPFTLYKDTSVGTIWSYSNWFGRLQLVSAPGQRDYADDEPALPTQTMLAVRLRGVERVDHLRITEDYFGGGTLDG